MALAGYDYVIIGSGSAGSVLAARLSEDPQRAFSCLRPGHRPQPVHAADAGRAGGAAEVGALQLGLLERAGTVSGRPAGHTIRAGAWSAALHRSTAWSICAAIRRTTTAGRAPTGSTLVLRPLPALFQTDGDERAGPERDCAAVGPAESDHPRLRQSAVQRLHRGGEGGRAGVHGRCQRASPGRHVQVRALDLRRREVKRREAVSASGPGARQYRLEDRGEGGAHPHRRARRPASNIVAGGARESSMRNARCCSAPAHSTRRRS